MKMYANSVKNVLRWLVWINETKYLLRWKRHETAITLPPLSVFYVPVCILQTQRKEHQVQVSHQRRRQRHAPRRKGSRDVRSTTQRCSVCSASPTQWQKIVSAEPLFRYIRASRILYGQALVTEPRARQRFLLKSCVKRLICICFL